MCREEEEEVEAPETGKYVLVKYCLTHDWRSGEHGKVREGKKNNKAYHGFHVSFTCTYSNRL